MSIKKYLSVFGSFVLVAFLVASLGSFPQKAVAAVNYYLNIDGIKGGSTAAGHQGSLELASWSFGASNPSSVGSGSAGAGKVSISSFNFMRKVDKASPQLKAASVSGTPIPSLSLSVPIKNSSQYLTITLENVVVSSYSVSSGGDRPMESVSMNYSKIEISGKNK